MKNTILILALIWCMAFFMAKPAAADEPLLTATKLYLDCKASLNDSPLNPQGTVDGSYCNGYMTAFLQAMTMAQPSNKSLSFCTPATSIFMIAKMYVGFIDNNPKFLSESPENTVINFLVSSFPCNLSK